MIVKEAATPQFNNNFRIREMINDMVNFGIRDVETFNAIHHLRKDGIIFAINPRTKYLIDQFQPIINQLTTNDRQIFLRLVDGIHKESELGKDLKNVDVKASIEKLKTQTLINEDLSLTQTGEVIGTLLKVVPDI